MRNHCGTPLSNSSTPVDTNHRRKPAPAMSDCGHDPRSQLKLMYSAPKVPGDEKFWHSLTSSVSAFQLPSRCPPPQIQLLGLLLDLKNRTEMRLTKSPPLQTRRIMHTWLAIHGSIYCGATTVLTWRAPNFELCPGTNPSTRVTKLWLTSRITRRIKHWNKPMMPSSWRGARCLLA